MSGFREWFFEQMGMYAAYHRDWCNQATHHIGVPLIVFSLILALTQVRLGYIAGLSVNAAPIVLGVLLLGYILAVPIVGILATVFYGALLWLAVVIAENQSPVLWAVVATCFIGGWIIQFVGHVFEGRKPALTVNAIQIFMAPPFLIAELLFLCGLQQALKANLQLRAAKYLL